DFVCVARFCQLHSGLNGVLTEWVHGHTNAGGFDAGAIGADANAYVVVDHAFYRDEDFHELLRQIVGSIAKLGRPGNPRLRNLWLPVSALLEKQTAAARTLQWFRGGTQPSPQGYGPRD